MKKVTEISDQAIENMTIELAISILIDGRKCKTCGNCLCDEAKHKKYSCSKSQTLASKYLAEHIDEITIQKEASNAPKISSPSDLISFTQTREFMRKRGFKQCYMCGTSLEGGNEE